MTLQRFALAGLFSLACLFTPAFAQEEEDFGPPGQEVLGEFDKLEAETADLDDDQLADQDAGCPHGCFLPNGHNRPRQKDLAAVRIRRFPKTAQICYKGKCHFRLLKPVGENRTYCLYVAVGIGGDFKVAISKRPTSKGHIIAVGRKNQWLFWEYVYRCN